ncbi:M56 family metallopeptidase [Streptomyces endophyticus]|uniref:M56 family metallopeptidase n=1 Tax=Streptomyces endophyticus TaxID=714166 RepID=A0ABU6F4C0_9ACTN|nr:M56 family metallopeptidase [Streptomyces endophyticus]MEB8338844.1 M56 family metallopeptidase [Streptomyces endophyticus]
MGIFVFLPLVLPLTAWPVARLAAHRLHPRTATRLLTCVAAVMAVCSTVCIGLLMVVGTAQLPGNPLPDGWSDPEVRAAVPQDEIAGKAAIPALLAVVAASARTLWRHFTLRRRAHSALAGLPATQVAVLPDPQAYAYALPGGGRGRIVVSTSLLDRLAPAERRALFAHERAHLTARHHRHLLAVRLAARANPFLRPLSSAVAYTAERWADEEAAALVGDRRVVARAIGKAALSAGGAREPLFAAFAAPGPLPRRVAALLAPPPGAPGRATAFTSVGLATWTAGFGAAASAMSSANSALTLAATLHAATPL